MNDGVSILDVHLGMVEIIAAILGAEGSFMVMSVLEGNHLTVLRFERHDFHKTRIGGRLAVRGGGVVERISYDGWTQWRFVEGARSMIPEVMADKAIDVADWLTYYFTGAPLLKVEREETGIDHEP